MDKLKDLIKKTEDNTKDYTKKDIDEGRIFAILSYLSFVSVIIYFCTDNKYSNFHAKQGFNLFIYESLLMLLSSFGFAFIMLNFVINIISLIILALGLLGMYYAYTGKAKKLPILDKISIIK
ncbi:MAG: hypothetical protein ACI33S_01485 [Bacilli bacterium]